MKLKSLFTAAIFATLFCVASQVAMAWCSSMPNIFGGYDYNYNGVTGSSMPNIFGGYDYTGPLFRGQPAVGDQFRGFSSMGNIFGGQDFYNNGTYVGGSMPNIFGGYDYNGPMFRGQPSPGDQFRGFSSMGNIFGGQDFYHNGTYVGGSMPNIFGGYDYNGPMFRGQQPAPKSNFNNEIFQGKIDEAAINMAIQMRNVNALLSSAWDLKGFETISNAKDENLNSDKLFDLAAQFAVEQNNAEALKACIALAPECQKYEEQLALKGQTRGAQKSFCETAFPELVYLQPRNWAEVLQNKLLSPWQQPVADVYLCGMFRGLAEPVAAETACYINNGRADMNPVMLAVGAAQLANFGYQQDFAPYFEPSSLLAEAVEMAVALNDKDALVKIQEIFEKSNLRNPEYAGYLADQIALLDNTRGMSAEVHPGTFTPEDARKLLHFELF